MNRLKSLFFVAFLLPLVSACASQSKLSDRALTRKMIDATTDQTGRINAKGKLYDGYDIAITGDSLEWYDGPDQSGKRRTTEVHDVNMVMIRHPHEGWPYVFAGAGFATGALVGSEVEFMASSVASNVDGTTHPFNVKTPLIMGAIGVPIGYFGALLFDPGVTENAWSLKINTPRGEK
jgi:hypothetical protein